jgi:hypothetical protein
MALAVEEDEAPDPSHVRLLGAATTVAKAVGLAHAIEEPGLPHAAIDLERHSW